MFIDAFLMATAFAYLACLVYTWMGKPPLIGVSDRVQMVFYLLAFIVFIFVSTSPSIPWLNNCLGILYSFGAVGSFIGFPQRWAAYWKDNPEEGSPEEGSAAGQMGMAAWDLMIATFCFMKSPYFMMLVLGGRG